MPKKMKITAATNNAGKLREIREISDCEVVSLKDAGIVSEPEENGKTLRQNAYIKAKAAYDLLQKSALDEFIIADDSGLFIEVLLGEPGVNSARFAEPGKRRAKVLALLNGIDERDAYFETVICLLDKDCEPKFFTGRLDGKIAYENRGENGFGYDSIFEVNGRTLAEMSESEKNAISHRKKALEKLKLYLEKL
ncbi:MAG: RdgB/HAM1 family non-canonical purine NTP pyrophosphatase [Ruminococcus sp.]|jgi:XTP/dITP diphosphohydrolase|nr:RdgB/HAM1 family non-canonical purine NTP pyrophosphatase [Ruminococcus sp.]